MAVTATRPASWPRRLAAAGPVPVHLAAGSGARPVLARLLADPGVELVASPRHATVLVVAGALPEADLTALARVHDQLPGPRATVWVSSEDPEPSTHPDPADSRKSATTAESLPLTGPHAQSAPHGHQEVRHHGGLPVSWVVADARDVVAAARRIHAGLLADPSRSEPPVTPAAHPVDWLGAGDFGQGGEGMMGGTPYGRPMAMTSDDLRDGLALDALTLPLGPFLPWLPAGVHLEVVLQGDVVQQATVDDTAASATGWGGAPAETPPPPDATIREIELLRARSHLTTVARLLWLHGLGALASRTARSALDVRPGRPEQVVRLAALLRRTHALDAATVRVGRLERDLVAALPTGPVARAGGIPADARSGDPAYARIGFEPCSRSGSDARARWEQLLDEAEQALWLAGRAGDQRPGQGGHETPRGTDPAATRRILLAALPDLLSGLELGAAATTVASLDLPDPAVAGAPARASS